MTTQPPIRIRSILTTVLLLFVWSTAVSTLHAAKPSDEITQLARRVDLKRGICVLLGTARPELPMQLARVTELMVYAQLEDERQVGQARRAAARAGLLGQRVYVEQGRPRQIHLADNLADVIVVASSLAGRDDAALRKELLRVLRPGGKALLQEEEITKPFPAGVGQWSHPYHGPDNNPVSKDKLARAPLMTHFLAEPWYCPMPQMTLVSGGRIFKAFGHVTFKRREWPLVNTLIAINGYNGTRLWQRKLRDGFMIHRNTMIATPEILYLADDESCKLIDTASGKLIDQIVPPEEVAGGRVWKWMALEDGVLYALLGGPEQKTVALRGTRTRAGWPWNELGKGYAQANYPWGFGNTLLAIDPRSKQVLWSYRDSDPLDSRATCMSHGRLFFYSHQNFLGCLNTKTGKLLWKTTDSGILEAIGQHDRAQAPSKGYASQTFAKCNDKAIYFAGPQRTKLVAVSAQDGKLLWQYPHGNFQLVLRDEALYAMGRTESSKKFDYLSGKILADLGCFRGNCTRATGTIDSIFTRGYRHRGTQRVVLESDRITRIGLMRPACQDGVIAAGGLLYWGPWMCDCNLQLVGVICLGPAGDFDFSQQAVEQDRLQHAAGDLHQVADFDIAAADWPTYRAGNQRLSGSPVQIGTNVRQRWQFTPASARDTTAPVTAGGLVFVGGQDGSVRALDAATGKQRWSALTGGRIGYPPAVWQGRVYAGSHDGWVYAWQASSGRLLWRFRAAPAERKIPVYGQLSSTWPVASGVLVENGIVYAAAGIASYDGTHVYALDAVTGKIRWQNNTSGRLMGSDSVSGISVQGHLLLHGKKLYLAGGNVSSPAVYDVQDGRCLNQLQQERNMAPRGRELFLVGSRVQTFDRLLYSPKPYQVGRYFSQSFAQASAGDVLIRGRAGRIVRIDPATIAAKKPRGLWESNALRSVDALAVTPGAVLATGQLASGSADKPGSYALVALSTKDGKPLWTQTLQIASSSWGLAVGREGRILVTLQDGRLVCFQ